MTKKILALGILVMMMFLIGCNSNRNNSNNNNNGDNTGTPEGNDNGNQTGDPSTGGSVEERNENGEYFYMAKVSNIDDKHHIAVEIIDSQIAFGTYWVLVGGQTTFVDEDGTSLTREDIKVGDTIEIIFSGQVMMSYPPQIAAIKIIRH